MMICVVIKGPTVEVAFQQLSRAAEYADLVELRLDCFDSLDLMTLKTLRSHFSIPMIFTLRSQIQGGNYALSEETRLDTIRCLMELRPEYLDLENHVALGFISEISTQYPETQLILSYHNFAETPQDLEKIYQEMQQIPAMYYKIALKANSSLDALRLICFAKQFGSKLIAISMGYCGQISRILGPVVGCPITYACIEEDQQSAPGQLSAKTLIKQYHHHTLNPKSALYGLIGDPVNLSISDQVHNRLITAFGLDAVYVKIQLKTSELSDFLNYAQQLSFQGLSVTMPLKEHMLPYVNYTDSQALEIGAVNTLCFKEGAIFGFNTDGVGALNAIEQQYPVIGKKIVIIGAGGAARAIATEAHRRGGLVTIINRDESKAIQLAKELHCIGKGLDSMALCAKEGYDILINCTPASQPVASDDILPHSIVMDIVTKPQETVFLKIAKAKGCSIIYGYSMFIEQALGQFKYWLENHFNLQEGRKILEKEVLDSLSF